MILQETFNVVRERIMSPGLPSGNQVKYYKPEIPGFETWL